MNGDHHPWIVELYDDDNPAGADHTYFRALAQRVRARRILDLGCGTGLLTRTLAGVGRSVIGVDPSTTMIDFATRQAGSSEVEWIVGDSSAIPGEEFDLVVMTGNVAQHIPDPDWERTLTDIRRACRTGTVLAFESRNPDARAWETWTTDVPSTRMTARGLLEEWSEARVLDSARVHVRFVNRFRDSDVTVVDEDIFTFRDEVTLTAQLSDAGFAVTAVCGDWSGAPFDGTQALIVLEARAV